MSGVARICYAELKIVLASVENVVVETVMVCALIGAGQ